jgi:hypothetical protein
MLRTGLNWVYTSNPNKPVYICFENKMDWSGLGNMYTNLRMGYD